jgi:triosephosphate isomerase
MILDVGCTYVILGHSERRHVFGEPDELINEKVGVALSAGLKPIVCVGEKLEQRKAGDTEKVVGDQVSSALQGVGREEMAAITLAYEPVWAIGTGETATPEQADEVHSAMRNLISEMYDQEVADQLVIQYGGSVKPHNAMDLLSCENVDGALVGGASLKAETFVPIIETARELG